jgi:hypothetical protein
MRVHPFARLQTFCASLALLSLAACDGGYDTNHDGVADDLGSAVDFDHDGDWDLFDIDRDGTLDGIGVDTDGDGIPDAIAVDADKDRFYESIDVGNGQVTRSQLVPLPAPVYPIGQNPKQP